ncbi:MAG: hypothetical protein LUE31_08795, partial [Lachnospiraceae bacterium]|nr:hypothetical protein [Lachnospiraceae bacterium]
MKLVRLLSASLITAALATGMSISASATTYEDAVEAAEEAGVQAINVQELENFLEPNVDYFTSDEYDDMIDVMNDIRDTYVTPLAEELFDKTPGELTEDEKITLGKNWSDDDRQDIIDTLVNLGAKYDVEVTVTFVSKSQYTVSAAISSDDDDSSSSGSGTTLVVTSDNVADTGAEAESDVNAGVLAGAMIADKPILILDEATSSV